MELYLDIETIPSQNPAVREEIRAGIAPPGNIKKPESIAAWMNENAADKADDEWRRTALNGTLGEVLAIGWATDSVGPWCRIRNLGESEADFLRNVYDEMKKDIWKGAPLFVGHNIKDFDLRFLFQRSVILGVAPPFDLQVGKRNPHLFDTMTEWAGWGGRIGLGSLCKALGIPCKSGMDGSMVWDYARAGRFDEIAEYCKSDVAAVREVYLRMTFQTVEQDEVSAVF